MCITAVTCGFAFFLDPATGLEVDTDPVPPPDPVMVQVAPLDHLPVHPGRALLLPVDLGHDPVHPTGGGTGAEAGGMFTCCV